MSAQELENKSVWSISDLCDYTGMSRGYIYQLTSRRAIPHSKPTGGRVFFDRDTIKAWLLHNEVSTAESLRAAALARTQFSL